MKIQIFSSSPQIWRVKDSFDIIIVLIKPGVLLEVTTLRSAFSEHLKILCFGYLVWQGLWNAELLTYLSRLGMIIVNILSHCLQTIAHQVWNCCNTYSFLLGRLRTKTFEHEVAQMIYSCHCMCWSRRFGEGNSNTWAECALVKITGKKMMRYFLWHRNQMVLSTMK